MLVLDAHDTTAPLLEQLGVVVVLLLEGDLELLEVLEVLLAGLGQSDASGGLHVAELAEVGLAADDAVGDVLSAAKGGQVDHGLDWVDVVGDHNELGLALLDELSHVVETELEVEGLGGLASTSLLSLSLESVPLLLAGLRHVLSHQLEQSGS